MNKIFSWIKNNNKNSVRKWHSSALNDNENDSANFDSFFEDRFAASSTPIINKQNQIDLSTQQLDEIKTIKTSVTLPHFTTLNSRPKNPNNKNQQAASSARYLKNKKKKNDATTTSEKDNLNTSVINIQPTNDLIPINISPTPSPSGSFRNSLRHLKRRLTSKRKNGMTEFENNLLPPQTLKKEIQILNKQNKLDQLNIDEHESNNKTKVVSIFIKEPSPEFQEKTIVSDQKLSEIELTKNSQNTQIQDYQQQSTTIEKPKLDLLQSKKNTNSNKKLQINELNNSKKKDNKKQISENDVLIASKFQPMQKVLSETIYLPFNLTETIVSTVQTSQKQNIIKKKSINRRRTISVSTDILKKVNNQKEQKVQHTNLENSNTVLTIEEKSLLAKKSNVLNQILNEKFDKLNEKKFYVNSASLLQPTLVSATAILSSNQNDSPKSETNSVVKSVSETTSINIKSQVINEKSILRKISSEDASSSALFDSVISKVETKSMFSTPQTARLERRRLRFYEPQISLSSFTKENNTMLNSSNSNNNNIFECEDDYDSTIPSTSCDLLPSMLSTSPKQSPTTVRCGLTNIQKRRASLAARRQSNVQLAHKVVGRRTSTTLIPLTAAQIHLVRALWRQVFLTKGPTIIGQTVMHRLGFKYPKLREQLRTCPLPIHHTNHDNFVKHHSKAIGDLIDLIVENLDNLQSVEIDLETIGRAHARLMNGQLSSKIWNLAAETFIDCTLEWGDRRCRSETVRKAWALIIAFAIEKIKFGHLDERKQMHLVRSTVNSLRNCDITKLSNSKSQTSKENDQII